MRCPDDIAVIVLEILDTALLRIRALCWGGHAEQSAIEANHVHNLPRLLADFSYDLLAYYWNVERDASTFGRAQKRTDRYGSRIGSSFDLTLEPSPCSRKLIRAVGVENNRL